MDLIQKYSDILGKGVGGLLSNVGKTVQPIARQAAPVISNIGNTVYKSLSQGPNPLQPFDPRTYIRPIPQIKIADKVNLKNPIQNTIVKSAIGIPESIWNAPGQLQSGIKKTVKDVQTGQLLQGGNLLQDVGQIGNPLLTLGTLGGGTVAKGIAKGVIKEAGIPALKTAIKQGAISGFKFGGATGVLSGLASSNDPLKQLEEVVKQGGMGALAGTALGGIVGGGANRVGALLNAMQKDLKMNPQQARNALGQWVKNEAGRVAQGGKVDIAKEQNIRINEAMGQPVGTPLMPDVVDQYLTKKLGLPEQRNYEVNAGLTVKQITPEERAILKSKVVSSNESRAIQQSFIDRVDKIRNTAGTPEEYLANLDKTIQDTISNSQGDKTVLSGIRTALNKELNGLVGVNGGYKNDYAMLQTLRKDPFNGPLIDAFENHIANIDNLLTKPSGKKLVQELKIKGQKTVSGQDTPSMSTSVESLDNQNLNNQNLPTSDGIIPQSRPLTQAEANKSINEWEAQIKKETITQNQLNTNKKRAFDQSMNEADASMNTTGIAKKGKVEDISSGFPSKALTSKTVKDKNPFFYQRETTLRNIEDTFGKDAPQVKAYFHDPIVANETAATKWRNNLRQNLEDTFNKAGIKRGSKEDYAAADLIEGNITLDQLKKEFPTSWKGIVDASEKGRAVYKETLAQINSVLTKYGYSPIPERQNYVTHTGQIQTLVDKFGSMLNFEKDKLPTEISAINMDTKPGRQFFKFGLQRQGGSTHEGLINSLDRYIDPASNQIFHTPDIQRGRALVKFLQERAGPQDTKLSNFASYLQQYTDSLAGKQNVIDRPLEKVFGRKLLSVGNFLKRRTGANQVGANLSSAITNFIPFTQSLATTDKPSAIKGMYQAALGPAEGISNIDGVTSSFLTRRFPKDQIGSTLYSQFKGAAGELFKIVDGFTSRSIVAGKYFEGLSKGLSKEQAMTQADEYAARVIADRSFGQVPMLFNSKTLGFLTQFQVEVNNQVSYLAKDIPKNFGYNKAQIASALVQFAVYSYLFNNLFEKVTGRRPQIDPIHAGISMFTGIQQGKSPTELLNPLDQNSPVGEIAQNLPFTSFAGGRIPVSSALPDFGKLSEGDLYGGLSGPAYNLLLPFGGGQVKKTVEGLGAFNQGYSATSNGNVRFPIEKTPTNAVKTSLFGQYAADEARPYFQNSSKPLSDKQSLAVKNADNKQNVFQIITDNRAKNAQLNKEKEKIKAGGTTTTNDDSLTKLQVEADGKGRYSKTGDYIYRKQDGTVGTVDITPKTKGTGIDAFTNQNEKYSQAREIFKNPDLTDKEKTVLYQKIGVDKATVEYDYKANHTNDVKAQYITSKASTMSHDALLRDLINGRVKSTSGAVFASDGVITALNQNGILSDAEAKYLKSVTYDRSGKNIGKSAKLKKVKAIKIKLPKAKKIKQYTVKAKKIKSYRLKKVKVLK